MSFMMIDCDIGDVLLIDGTYYTICTNAQGAVFLEARAGAGVGAGDCIGPGGTGTPTYAVGIKKEF